MTRSENILASVVRGARQAWASKPLRHLAVLLAVVIVGPGCPASHNGLPPTPGTLQFTLSNFTVAENVAGGLATITVSRGGGSLGAVSVDYATSNGTAGVGDYTTANGTLTWAAGDAADKTFTIAITNDGLTEGDETINLTLSLPTGGATLGAPSTATLTITDDDAPAAGVLQFSSPTYTVGEGTPTLTITVTRTGGTAGAASVNFVDVVGGTAGGGVDYNLAGGTLNWAAGEGGPKTFNITIIDDATVEVDETINLGLNTFVGAVAGTTTSAVVTIVDNDSNGTLGFSAPSYNVTESGVTATITVKRTGGSGGAVGVTYATSDGTATVAGSDYTPAAGTLSWAAGETADKTFTVAINNDTLIEGNETVNLTLSAPTGGAALGQALATLNILDDDCTVEFTAATFNIVEGIGTASITVSRTGSTLGAISVDVTNPAGGTATGGGTDYTFSPATQTLSWGIGVGGNQTINIPFVADTLKEGNETFNLALSNVAGVGARMGTQDTTVVTIVDDDVSFTFTLAASSVLESGGNGILTVNRVGASVGAASVTWTVTGGTATNPADFTGPTTGTLNWPTTDTTPRTITLPIVNDNVVEPDDTIIVTLSAPTLAGGDSVVLGATPQTTLTITNDDTNLDFSSATYSGAENGGAITVTVNRTGVTTGTSTVTWSIPAGGTASAGDYTATPGLLTFGPGVLTRTFTITPVNDATVEGSETLNLSLTGPAPAGTTLGAVNTAVLTILDDDVPNASINNVTQAEGNAGTTNFTFTITLSAAPVVAGSVTVNTANGTAAAGSDYTALVSQVIPFGVGVTSMPVVVVVNGDTTDELDETFTVNLSSPVNLNITGATGTGTITNDDDPTISIANNSTTEGNAGTKLLPFTVTLSHASLQDVVVNYSTANGTATAASGDYVAVAGGTMTITAGNLTGTINITINGDTVDEADETFTVTLNSATNTSGALPGPATGTIQNDDAPTITIGNLSAAEGTGATTLFNVPVSITNPSSQPITLTFSTADGPVGPNGAIAGADYTAVIGGTILIPAGNPGPFQIPITVTADSVDEADETFTVTLTGASYGAIGGANVATVTIQDDDGPTVSINNVTQAEGNGGPGSTPFVFTVTLSAPSPQPVQVTYSTVNGSATAPSDFTAQTNQILIIPALAPSGTITILVNGDTTGEPDETFTVVLSNPVNCSIVGAVGTGTIQTDDPTGINISPVTQNEGNAGTTTFTFAVTLTNTIGTPVTVDFATSPTGANPATAGSDYVTATGTLTFLAGQLTPTVPLTVTVNGDLTLEPNETFLVTLSNASVNAQILTPTALGTIVNDDGPDITIGNVTQAEGNAGTSNFVFTVNLSGPSASDVSFNFATSDVSATTADGDYIATSGSKTILAGNTSTTITVQVVGDNKKEPNETFNVTLSGAVNGNIVGGPGIGTITDDDPTPSISINDVSQAEGNSGLTAFNFTLSLSNPSSQTITVLANTADGTATLADNDYQQIINQTVTFPPGSTSQPFTVNVVGDATTEPDQTFFVNLSGQTNSTILDGQGQGTILNDEGPSVTGTTPTNSQTGVSIGTHMVVTFSMAMDPATFTSGTTVTLSPDPSAGAVSPLMQFFWNGGFTQVTIVFDTKLPVGVHGDDVLAESTIYTVTVKGGAAGVKSSIASGSLQMAGDYVTQFTTTLDATPPTVTSIVPDINNPVPAGTSTFTVTWSEPMNKTQGNVQIQSNGSYQADAQLNPPSSNGMTLGWNGPGTVLTINLTTPLPARGLFRFGTNNFNDLNNNFYDNPNNDQVFVTPAAGDATPPTVVSFYPATGSVGVSRDQEILIGFSEGMWPADLLSAAKITVATNIGVLPVMTREIIDFPGVFIEPLKAWPANATITVTVLNTVRDAAGITKAANQAFTFTVGAGDVVNPPVIDAPFSTLANNDQDLDPNQLQESLVFKNSSSGARAFMNSQSSAPQDLTLVEQATGIPLKGFTADTRNNGLEIRGMQSGSFTGFTVTGGGTMYTLTLNPTLQNTMGVAIASTPINFRVKSTGGNARPRFGGSFDARYKTTPAGIKADLQTWAWDPDGDALTVTATDSPDVGFVKPLVSSGGNFQYNTPGSNEATLPTVGAHVLTITLVDTPGGHSVPLAQKTYKQNAAFMPTLVAPTSTGLGRPVFTWPAVSNNVGHDAMALVIMDNTGNEFYSVIVNKNATTFTVPVDMTLPNGSYQWTLNFFTASDGSFRGNGGGEGNSTLVPFTVP